MNSYAVTGKTDPCPNCGSQDVRWRGRRWYDIPLNFLRYIVEALLHTLGFGSKSPSQYAPEFREALQHEKLYDDRMSAQTPRRFWKCPACKQRGEVFDDLGELGRSTLAQTYDRAQDYYYRQNDHDPPRRR
jgi:hypothetical protein